MITICTMICFAPITHFVNQLCRLIFGAGFSLDTLVCYAVLAGMLLASLRQLHFQLKLDVLIVSIGFLVAFALSYTFAEGNKDFMFTQWTDFAGNPAYLLFVYSIPAYVFMRYVTDYDQMFETCQRFSLIVVFCSVGSFVIMLLRDSQPEYMSFSYNLVFATILSFIYYFEKKKGLPLIAAIVGGIMIFLAGARGPLACVFFSMISYFLISKASVGKKIFLACFLLTGGVIILILWQQILTSLKDSMDSIGVSSRTLELLIEGEFSSDSGRGDIQLRIIESFTLFGRGLYGDRTIGENHYAHNLIIELIAQWGLLLGTVIVVTLCVLFFKGFRTKNDALRLLVLALFSSSVVKLMLSGSYLAHNAALFVLIGACVNSLEMEHAQPAGADARSQKKKSKYIKAYSRYS